MQQDASQVNKLELNMQTLACLALNMLQKT